MTNKLKRRVRAQMEKTGMSHQAVLNAKRGPPPSPPSDPSPLKRLLNELHADSIAAVQSGVLRPHARSANLAVAIANAGRARGFVAKTGRIERSVSEKEHQLLLSAGAAGDDVQVFRMFANPPTRSFSDQCRRCGRWIWLGVEERVTTCLCGQPYRVVFDAPREDWRRQQGMRCIHCGEPFGMAERSRGLSPWHVISEWQQRCALCADEAARGSDLRIERDEQSGRFVRHSNRVDLGEVRAFVAEHRVTVDWDRDVRSSTGEVNGQTLEFWRLPILD